MFSLAIVFHYVVGSTMYLWTIYKSNFYELGALHGFIGLSVSILPALVGLQQIDRQMKYGQFLYKANCSDVCYYTGSIIYGVTNMFYCMGLAS